MSFLQSSINSYFKDQKPYQIVRTTLLAAAGVYYGSKFASAVAKDGLKKTVMSYALGAVKFVPGAAGTIEAEQKKVLSKMEGMIIPAEARTETEVHIRLPAQGRDRAQLMTRFTEWNTKETAKWSAGQVSGGIYHGNQQFANWLSQVYSLFSLSNPLHPDVFPYIRKMESECVSMTLGMFHGYNDDDATATASVVSADSKDSKSAAAAGVARPKRDYCGVMTSGGTESIIMALKAYRDRAAATLGITDEPEIIIANSAHAAFNKGAQYFKMKVITIGVDPHTYALDLKQLRAAITPKTILIVGSAPSFPHGIIDPIEEMSKIALEFNIGLHVDSCLGGFLLPFMAKAGYPLPFKFDFLLPGVTSISADTHKYGAAVKGTSVLMYASKSLRSYQYFVAPDWTGGIYASPSMAGSRPGGLIAATWAAMVAMGESGYVECCRAIMDSAKRIASGVAQIDGLKVVGTPQASVIAFTSTDPTNLNIYKVGEAMGQRHWNLNTLQKPGAVHICVTYLHRDEVATKFLSDLRDACKDVRSNPNGYKNGSAAIYGMAESIPDVSLITDLAKGFLDTLYMTIPAPTSGSGSGSAAAASASGSGHPKSA